MGYCFKHLALAGSRYRSSVLDLPLTDFLQMCSLYVLV